MKIIWSPLSIKRVVEIIEYIALDNENAASEWAASLFEKVEQLSEFPKSGRIVPEANKERIRELIFGNYRIIYSISSKAISILTVRNSRQMLRDDELK